MADRVLPIVAILLIVSVEYGGWALLTFITGREGLSAAQQRMFRAGHAHAGVLLVLSRYGEIAEIPGGLSFLGDERAAAELSVALGLAGVGITALVPRTATLDELFFSMTEGPSMNDHAKVAVR